MGKTIGGQGGIRTHGTVSRTLVFKTRALNHSATCPCRCHTRFFAADIFGFCARQNAVRFVKFVSEFSIDRRSLPGLLPIHQRLAF